MAPNKPTYEELQRQVKELEAEVRKLDQAQNALKKRASLAKEAAEIALVGHWELDLVNNTLFWSDEIYRMFGLAPDDFEATYEAFLENVHPDDRDLVNQSYTTSISNRTGYDIVHRLQLKNGTIKYVHEKCKTEYDESGTPLRSLGTVQDVTKRIRAASSFAGIVGQTSQMKTVYETIRELADVKVPVLIQGETGTGKELAAAAIHSQGPRANQPFVPVNCSALPEGLLESELFGHVRGAFTGAIRDKKGRFELAHGGSLFLDEIADMPKTLQVKLLRVIQEGKLERVGGETTIPVDVRLISATNRDLKREVEQGNFREDLFYRIRVVPISMPPLRDRRNDIPILVEFFLERAASEGQHSRGISPDAIALMLDYRWPGNVRELQSAVQYALIKSKGQRIQPGHLPIELRPAGRSLSSSPPGEQTSYPRPAVRKSRRKLDRESVAKALKQSGGNKVKAAKLLGVGRATLYRFISSLDER